MDRKGNSQLRILLDKGVRLTDMTMMKCQVCDDIDYYPITHLSNLEGTFVCNNCFFKLGTSFTCETLVADAKEKLTPSTSDSTEEIYDDSMEPQIIITNVRSLAQDNVLKPVMQGVDLDLKYPPVKEKLDETPANFISDWSTNRNANIERQRIGQEEKNTGIAEDPIVIDDD